MEVVNCFEVSPLEGEEDYISSMPENVIVNVMDRLPVKDAVGTSILSTSWRFKWTLLTKLILDVDFFDGLDNHFDKNNITKLLLHLKGPVTNFKLFVSNRFKIDFEDIYHWVMLLSGLRGLMELTLMNWRQLVRLPTHLFSCLELRHLTFNRCVFPHGFLGFPKLLSLHLEHVYIPDHRCGELIAQCPLLETLQISSWNANLGGVLKLVEIAKLKNLKELCLSLCLLDNLTMLKLSTVFQQMSLLPKLQELSLDFENCKFLPEDVALYLVSSNFPFLKTLELWEMDFSSVSMLSCAFGILFGCANLQNLSITAIYNKVVPLPAICLPEVD
uniref:F-box/FBD/LRR-repeat protein At1g13570-like n=1 Tax=Erigeron canadensis TaxID=72917 RepID=UPI001CB94F8F|nr:F-box/FBD/LRR-repeat protein At1g13570-like [Erigeron canadensis]XP_043617452.1 F-box/FBD/LRR-repeat protein At1g13570-like [Erigeron canadensis]